MLLSVSKHLRKNSLLTLAFYSVDNLVMKMSLRTATIRLISDLLCPEAESKNNLMLQSEIYKYDKLEFMQLILRKLFI